MPKFVQITLLSAPFASLTYEVPPWFAFASWPAGLRVLVPLGRSVRVGVVDGPAGSLPEGVQAKPVLWPMEAAPILDARYLDMARNLAGRQSRHVGQILGTLLPLGLRSGKASYEVREEGFWKSLDVKRLKALPDEAKARLARLWEEGGMRPKSAGERSESVCVLAVEPPWPVRPGAKRQIAILDHLYDQGASTPSRLRKVFGADVGPALKRLAAVGAVVLREDCAADLPEACAPCAPRASQSGRAAVCGRAFFASPLTPEQETAFDALRRAMTAFSGEIRLAHGVTGSGKTRLYLELVRECLAAGREAVLLAPEVALASQLLRSVTAAFPEEPVAFTHGYLSPSRREAVFRSVAGAGGPRIVVGTRSALFLPLRNPGLIVLDEEHDASFKQDERLAYQAKEVAFFLSRATGALLLLGSATPDVKTFYAARSGAVPMVSMRERVGEGGRPEVEIVDMRGAAKVASIAGQRETGDRAGILTEQAAGALRQTVERGEQAIIMLNRRGYAPLLYCLSCEQTLRCPECELALTYHKGRERLVCHYCGLTRDFPAPCTTCGGAEFLPMGVGSELLEEQLAGVLPSGVSVLRLDRDSAKKTGRLDEIIASFAAGEAQVMVGTQMLSKGHHFPNVTLVAVADGDMGRNLPDYRSAERTFQLLVQVSGRAGRGDAPGKVLIQTRNPEDPFWKFVLEADYEGFFEAELAKRQKYLYPPFAKLGLIRMSFPREYEKGLSAVSALAAGLRERAKPLGVTVLGPAPAPLAVIAGRRRYNCLLKSDDWGAIRQIFAAGLAVVGRSSHLRLHLDLDPVDML